MPLPLSYNLKNLTVRKTTTLMTALGIGLTVAVLLGILASGRRTWKRLSRPPAIRSTCW